MLTGMVRKRQGRAVDLGLLVVLVMVVLTAEEVKGVVSSTGLSVKDLGALAR